MPAYQDSVLPPDVTARVAVEAGISMGWHEFVGSGGRIIGIDRFGASAPAAKVFEAYGLTVDHVAEVAQQLVTAAQAHEYHQKKSRK